jgi:hypothetical protein
MTSHIRILIAGAVLILAGNAVALIGVAYNRAGEPDAVIELSERELILPYNFLAAEENSGLALHLAWRAESNAQSPYAGMISGGGATPWLDKDKLAELGFDVSASPQDQDAALRYEKMLPRKAYVVLEFNGAAYQAALHQRQGELSEAQALQANNPGKKEFEERVKTAQTQLDREQNTSSRLFAIDVGRDQQTLRSRYSDRARYLILPGEVRLQLINKELSGFITNLSAGIINVPLADRAAITGGARPAHYTVRLAFGKRAEPWIMAVRAEGNENAVK